MNERDDIILEYLQAIAPSAEPPAVIQFNLEFQRRDEFEIDNRLQEMFTKDTLRNRLVKLESIGLVDIVRETGKYRAITEQGMAYLAGELDASDLED